MISDRRFCGNFYGILLVSKNVWSKARADFNLFTNNHVTHLTFADVKPLFFIIAHFNKMESMENLFTNVWSSHQNDTTYCQIQNQLIIHDHNSAECLVFGKFVSHAKTRHFGVTRSVSKNRGVRGNDQGWLCLPSFYSVRRGGGKKAGGERNRDGKTGAGRRAGPGTFHWRKSRKKASTPSGKRTPANIIFGAINLRTRINIFGRAKC